MAESMTLEVVTPDGGVLKEVVEEITAPSVNGQFGVLPGHRPMLAALQTGIVTYKRGGVEERIAVGPGFIEVRGGVEREFGAVCITDRFAKVQDVDAVRARLDLKEADEKLAAFAGEPGSVEHRELIAEELWAAVRLELYGDPPSPTLCAYAEGSVAETFGSHDAGSPDTASE